MSPKCNWVVGVWAATHDFCAGQGGISVFIHPFIHSGPYKSIDFIIFKAYLKTSYLKTWLSSKQQKSNLATLKLIVSVPKASTWH